MYEREKKRFTKKCNLFTFKTNFEAPFFFIHIFIIIIPVKSCFLLNAEDKNLTQFVPKMITAIRYGGAYGPYLNEIRQYGGGRFTFFIVTVFMLPPAPPPTICLSTNPQSLMFFF